jgi:ribonuclease HepT-like protein
VVNGLLTRPKERRSFKPEVESSILSGRIPLPSGQRRALPGAEPNPGDALARDAGMGDKLIHDYFGVDLDLVWDVVAIPNCP